jgi:C4-dicarboxylate-binding protein DctP
MFAAKPAAREETMSRITRRTALGLAAAAPFAIGKAAHADPLIIKFSHVVTPDAPKGKAAVLFKQLAEKYTDGKVSVEVYPNSSLYKDKEELEALQLGSVHLLAPSISKFGPLGVKEFDVFDLPFLMSDDVHARAMMASPMMDLFNKKLEDKGVTPLGYWDNGPQLYTANVPLIMPDDFRGLKMRIQGSKVLDAVARQLGALPQIIAFSELYQALQTGVVAKDNVTAMDTIKASGKTEIHVLTDTEKQAWIAKLMPVHKEMEGRFGKEFIAQIYKASGFVPPQS